MNEGESAGEFVGQRIVLAVWRIEGAADSSIRLLSGGAGGKGG
jgi:hypothetical protein